MQNTRLIRNLLTLADSMPDMVSECAILEEAVGYLEMTTNGRK